MDGDMLPHRDDILWLPTLTNDTHYGKESEYLRKMIEIAHQANAPVNNTRPCTMRTLT